MEVVHRRVLDVWIAIANTIAAQVKVAVEVDVAVTNAVMAVITESLSAAGVSAGNCAEKGGNWPI